ncbi:hypothetical protein AAKU64_000022 [Undibacterium sp. GrIS 1.8]|uniref:hypothetical protein n=1 Tax=unclassified Undibacterium TaxID=2630295 RepID=UPI0033916A5F
MKIFRFAAILVLVAMTVSCARMQFFTNPDLSGAETGIKFYTPKPYLLIARTGNKDKPVDVQSIYIPDLSKPIYAKATPGYGSADVSIALSNGMLTNFGSKTDSSIPALITALGGFDQALAGASKTRKETDLLKPQSGVNYNEQGIALKQIAADLNTTIKSAQPLQLTQNEQKTGSEIATQIEAAGKLLIGPTGEQNLLAALTNLKATSKSWSEHIIASKAPGAPGMAIRDNLDRLKGELDGVIEKISPQRDDAPTFTLYEIDNTTGTTKLIEVKF